MQRIKRDAFLYLDGSKADFAQCSSCWMFTGNRCAVLGNNLTVFGEDSCGYWGPGKYDKTIRVTSRFTPQQVGFVRHKVRCENCRFFDDGACGLYNRLNNRFPEHFNLDIFVKPRGCCNAQEPK